MTKPRPTAAVLVALLFLSTAPAAAQVGHPPGRSPYRDIPKGHTVTPFVAQFGGSGGRFGIAPHDGPVFGVRYDIRTSYALQLGIGVGRGTLERLVVDPFVAVAERVKRPGGSEGVVRRREPPAQPHRRQDVAPAGAVRRARRRPHVPVQHRVRFQRVRAGPQDLLRPACRVPVLRPGPGPSAGRRPGAVLEAQLSRQLHAGARRPIPPRRP